MIHFLLHLIWYWEPNQMYGYEFAICQSLFLYPNVSAHKEREYKECYVVKWEDNLCIYFMMLSYFSGSLG